ncbi:MAG: hypothetical protein WAQ98_18400 [Blastocatellia bacterium]
MTNEEIKDLMEFILKQQAEFRADLANFERITGNRIQFIVEQQASFESRQAEFDKRQAELEHKLTESENRLNDKLEALAETVNNMFKVLDFVSGVALETKQRVIQLEQDKNKNQ